MILKNVLCFFLSLFIFMPNSFGKTSIQRLVQEHKQKKNPSRRSPSTSSGSPSGRAGARKKKKKRAKKARIKKKKKRKKKEPVYPEIPIKKKGDKTIVPICTSFPLKGDHSIVGKKLLAGTKNYLKVFKKFLKITNEKDFGYKIVHKGNNNLVNERGLKKIKKLLKKSPVFTGLLSTDILLALLPMIKKKKLVTLFPTDGVKEIREKKNENIVYFRASHEDEMKALAWYTISVKRRRNIAIFYEESAWGDDVLESLKKVLKDYGVEPIMISAYPQGTVEIGYALGKIAAKAPSAIFCIANPRAAYSFIRKALNKGLHKCLFVGPSRLSTIQQLLRSSRGFDVVVSSVVPYSKKSELLIAQEFRKVMKRFLANRDDSPFYFEAYINLALLVEALKHIKKDVTIGKIIGELESFKDFDFKGLKLNFDPKTRTLCSDVWINPGIDKKWIKAQASKKDV